MITVETVLLNLVGWDMMGSFFLKTQWVCVGRHFLCLWEGLHIKSLEDQATNVKKWFVS